MRANDSLSFCAQFGACKISCIHNTSLSILFCSLSQSSCELMLVTRFGHSEPFTFHATIRYVNFSIFCLLSNDAANDKIRTKSEPFCYHLCLEGFFASVLFIFHNLVYCKWRSDPMISKLFVYVVGVGGREFLAFPNFIGMNRARHYTYSWPTKKPKDDLTTQSKTNAL